MLSQVKIDDAEQEVANEPNKKKKKAGIKVEGQF